MPLVFVVYDDGPDSEHSSHLLKKLEPLVTQKDPSYWNYHLLSKLLSSVQAESTQNNSTKPPKIFTALHCIGYLCYYTMPSEETPQTQWLKTAITCSHGSITELGWLSLLWLWEALLQAVGPAGLLWEALLQMCYFGLGWKVVISLGKCLSGIWQTQRASGDTEVLQRPRLRTVYVTYVHIPLSKPRYMGKLKVKRWATFPASIRGEELGLIIQFTLIILLPKIFHLYSSHNLGPFFLVHMASTWCQLTREWADSK